MVQVTNSTGPSIKHPLALGAAASRFWVPQKNGAEKGDIFMSYFSAVQESPSSPP